MKEYTDQLEGFLLAEPVLGVEVLRLKNLEGILRWAPESGIPLSGIDLVQQDEYSYDLLLPLNESRWLVFGVT